MSLSNITGKKQYSCQIFSEREGSATLSYFSVGFKNIRYDLGTASGMIRGTQMQIAPKLLGKLQYFRVSRISAVIRGNHSAVISLNIGTRQALILLLKP